MEERVGRQSRGDKKEKNSVGREKWDVNREHRGGGEYLGKEDALEQGG